MEENTQDTAPLSPTLIAAQAIEATENLEAEIPAIVGRELDARLRKLMVSVWVMILGGLGSLVFLGVQWGSLKEKVAANEKADSGHHHDISLHMGTAEKFATFVPRTEWTNRVVSQDRAMGEVKGSLDRLEDKVDKLLLKGGAE